MNIIAFPYGPAVIGIDKYVNYDKFYIIGQSSYKDIYEKLNIKYLTLLEEYNFNNVFKTIQKISQEHKIEKIIFLGEEDIEFGGMINEYYHIQKVPNTLTAKLYRDKYMMRIYAQDIVNVPKFWEIENCNDIKNIITEGKKYVLKPRDKAGAVGVRTIKTNKDIENISGSLEGYILEEFVDCDVMFTVDGIAYNKGICEFSVHEYEMPILESLETSKKGVVVRTSRFYQKNPRIIKKLFDNTKRVIERFSKNNEIYGFHFEWFYDEKQEILTLCEAGARFGGGEIPLLYEIEYEKSLLEKYWNYISEKEMPISITADQIEIPKHIAATVMPYRRKGIVRSLPSEDRFTFAKKIRIFVQEGDALENINSCVENLLMCVFSAENEEEYKNRIDYIENIVKNEFVIEPI